MNKQATCIHNKAIYPEMGSICDRRTPNSLCKNCKQYKSKRSKLVRKIINKI